MGFVDLSVAINEQTPVYPGDPATSIKSAGVLERDGFTDHVVSMGTHIGTHMDAPMHMLEDGRSLDSFAVDSFVGPGRYIQVQAGDFSAVKQVDIQAGDIVLFHTGMSDKYHDASYFEEYPAMSKDVAQCLVDKKIKMVGVDACSVDTQDGFPIHKILLSGDVLILENLTNLSQLNDKNFRVYALPIKLQIDGAPARVMAEIEK